MEVSLISTWDTAATSFSAERKANLPKKEELSTSFDTDTVLLARVISFVSDVIEPVPKVKSPILESAAACIVESNIVWPVTLTEPSTLRELLSSVAPSTCKFPPEWSNPCLIHTDLLLENVILLSAKGGPSM